jgi:hypothetical protein
MARLGKLESQVRSSGTMPVFALIGRECGGNEKGLEDVM